MKIALFGGDKRMLFAAQGFIGEGHEVYAAGFDKLYSLCDIRICGYEEAAEISDIAVLPVRPIADGGLLSPFSDRRVGILELMKLIGKKPVFTGCKEMIKSDAAGQVFDYAKEEYFISRNAELTAEGAVGILITEYEGSISGTDVLVTGFGRIGKVLARYLKSMGADVTAAARKPSDRELIERSGMRAVDYPDIDYSSYRVIINTVPASVIGQKAIDRMREDVFIIDLASAPGGVDHAYANDKEISVIHALALPGKTAPLAAGMIIKDTIMNMLSRDVTRE